ncbi:MAG: response regulator [Sphingomonas sp.]|nr:MAG: response regulator [Sphingomonas sp.]
MTALLAGRRILVVEDEMLVLMQIEMALEDLGCSEVCAAASVADALDKLAGRRFDAAMVRARSDSARGGNGDHGDRC